MKTRDFSFGRKIRGKKGKPFLLTTAFYQASPIEPFLFHEHKSPFGGKSVRITSDVYMLFNQQRLDRMTSNALIDHFNNLSQSSPSFSQLKSKLSDEQLIKFIKMRYIQSPSELLQWSQYLNALAEGELAAFVEANNLKPDDPVTDPAQAVKDVKLQTT